MSTIYEDPQNVYVVAYVWRRGAASGGVQQLFGSKRDAERYLAECVERGEIDFKHPIWVSRLTDATWERLPVQLPIPLKIGNDE